MYLLLYISLGFGAIALSLLMLEILWLESKADEAYDLFMQTRPPIVLIGMRGGRVAVHWYTAHRYYRYKWSVYVRIRRKIRHYALASSLLGLLCVITA